MCKTIQLVKLTIFTTIMFLAACSNGVSTQTTTPKITLPFQYLENIDKNGFNEPSGICWHTQRKTLFVVGDAGDVCELTTDGTVIKEKHVRNADFEGITHDPATGLLYIAVEGAEAILELNPETFAVLREFTLPRTLEGKTLMKAGRQGIEAITFMPDSSHSEGGIFLVANQAFDLSNDADISAIFQFELPLRSETEDVKLIGYFTPGIIDLSGLYYDAASDHIFVISDATNIMLEYSRDYKLLHQFALPCDNQEGITIDSDGNLYIAQDSGGIIKFQPLNH
jgi:uncharacterized protein YjiK